MSSRRGSGQQGGNQQGGIVALHAHPDDESITMGGTFAKYVSAGCPVTVVTATLGECGETMYGAHDGIIAARADQLGGFRYAELRQAMDALGVTDQRMLGGLGRFRDSGMAGEESAEHPRAFWQAQRGGILHDESVINFYDVLAELRPAVALTYDATGGYGHPDHIAAHQVALAAAQRFNSDNPVQPVRLLSVVRPRAVVSEALDALWTGPVAAKYSRPALDDLGTLTALEADVAVDVGMWRAARRAAMAAHTTQLDVWAGVVDGFALTNMWAQPLLDIEFYDVLAGPPAPPEATDLFAGLAPTVAG